MPQAHASDLSTMTQTVANNERRTHFACVESICNAYRKCCCGTLSLLESTSFLRECWLLSSMKPCCHIPRRSALLIQSGYRKNWCWSGSGKPCSSCAKVCKVNPSHSTARSMACCHCISVRASLLCSSQVLEMHACAISQTCCTLSQLLYTCCVCAPAWLPMAAAPLAPSQHSASQIMPNLESNLQPCNARQTFCSTSMQAAMYPCSTMKAP